MRAWGWVGVWAIVFFLQMSFLYLKFKKYEEEFTENTVMSFCCFSSIAFTLIESAIVHYWIR